VDAVLEAIVHRLPPPTATQRASPGSYLDSWFDAYRGVIVLVRVMQGVMRKGMRIRLMSNASRLKWSRWACSCPSPSRLLNCAPASGFLCRDDQKRR